LLAVGRTPPVVGLSPTMLYPDYATIANAQVSSKNNKKSLQEKLLKEESLNLNLTLNHFSW
jgi:hypothetical protein